LDKCALNAGKLLTVSFAYMANIADSTWIYAVDENERGIKEAPMAPHTSVE
jgi:hypothetical protein